MNLDAIIFDFDGLILDTETCEFESLCEIFDEHGVTLDRAWFESVIGRADHPHWSEMLEAALGAPLTDRDAVIARRRDRHHALIAELEVCVGVVDLLDEAAAADVAVGVASSSTREWVEGHLDRLGLLGRFEAVCTRDDVGAGRAKPAPDVYLAALDALGAAPGRSVAIEDSPNGVRAARAAGLTAIAVPGPMTSNLDFTHADLVVESLRDLSLRELAALASTS